MYRYKVLKENNFVTKANEEKSNIENTILNGGISYNKYIWRAENSADTCDLCKALDGKVFDSYDEVPTRPHPNCQCRVEVLEDNYEKLKDLPQRTKKKSCDCITSLPSEFKLLVDNIQNLQNHIKNMVYNILTYLKTNSSVIYKEACENIINQAMYWFDTIKAADTDKDGYLNDAEEANLLKNTSFSDQFGVEEYYISTVDLTIFNTVFD